MQKLKAAYEEKCEKLSVQPIPCVIAELEAANKSERTLKALRLRGSGKELFNKRVQYMQVFALTEALLTDECIVFLDLSYNFIQDDGALCVARLLKFNKALRYLSLEGNDIGGEGAAAIAAELHRQPGGDAALEMLNLHGNPIGNPGALALAEMLRGNSTLRMLDVGQCDVNEAGIIAVAAALSEVNCTLEVLGLEDPLLQHPQASTTQHLARMLATNSSLKELYLGKHRLSDHDFELLLLYGLLRNDSLHVLDLRCNKLTAFSAPHLARLLSEKTNLQMLNLAHNSLGNEGAVLLSRALPYNLSLRQLDLRGKSIGDTGLLAVAEALGANMYLQEVLLQGNVFGSASAAALASLGATDAAAGRELRLDVKPYVVDGRHQVALLDPPEPV